MTYFCSIESKTLVQSAAFVNAMADDFFVRCLPPPSPPSPSIIAHPTHASLSYYIGHKGRHGHEFLEFEISSDGKLRYANNSLYKQVQRCFQRAVVLQLKCA